ncbi:MAG: hypothetical protein IPL32_01935 [Chloracidobacterium sp.]|nr:hypothetical protein [Chloracidobacterium sp.]
MWNIEGSVRIGFFDSRVLRGFPEGQIATLVYGVVKIARIDRKGVSTSLLRLA